MRLTRYLEESISLLPTLFAAIVFGPLAAMLVAAASMIGAFGPSLSQVGDLHLHKSADRCCDWSRGRLGCGL